MLRAVTLVNAVVLNVYRHDAFARPTAGALVVVGMVVWTGVATWAYADGVRRGWPLLVADLAIALAAMASTPWVKTATFNATVPGFWVMAALLAWAIRFRWVGGLVAAVLVGTTDLVLRDHVTQTNYGNLFLLLIGGPIVGYMCGSLQQMAVERDRAERSAAAAAERARLARVVHDGVLQVLALVQRRGAEIGGPAAELGRLAGEQETALRRLIRSQDAVSADTEAGDLDLVVALAATCARPGVHLAAPGEPVELAAPLVRELAAVVGACLDNVTAHVGDGAPAWVLLEVLPDRVEVTVRDEGPGIAEGRLAEAAAEGRLGVSQSVLGRMADLGGTAHVHTGPHGTEWELVMPLDHPGART